LHSTETVDIDSGKAFITGVLEY